MFEYACVYSFTYLPKQKRAGVIKVARILYVVIHFRYTF